MSALRSIDVADLGAIEADPVGELPELKWIPIELLGVDDAYQRQLGKINQKAIRKIANNFNWAHFGNVAVAPRGDRFAIIDGQHRVHAAAAVGIDQVPCQIQKLNQSEQAAAFSAINGAVTAVTIWQLFKASLVAGEEWAVEADRAVKLAGCSLMTSNKTSESKAPGEIFSIKMIQKYVEAGKADKLTLALKLLIGSDVGSKEPQLWTSLWLSAWLQVFTERSRLFAQHGIPTLLTKINTIDFYQLEDRVDEQYKVRRRSGLTSGISKTELLAAELGTVIDRLFPSRMALPQVRADQ